VPFADIEAAVEGTLGRPLPAVYAEFDEQPIAAASIGQVHAARLHDGTEVVVKVRRPGVVDQIEIDLDVMARASRVAGRVGALARYDPEGLAQEFATTLRGELDYLREAHNAEQLAAAFADDDRVHIPKVFREHTRAAVITEARVRGVKIDDLDALDRAGIDRVAVARAFADAYLSMVFVFRFFHADPHPGNVFVGEHGRIGFVDFGMVGEVTARTARGLGVVLVALTGTDAARMADGLLRLGVATSDADRPALERDLARLLERHAHVPLEELHVGPLLAEVMGVVRAHRLRLPSDLALLLKTVMMCEGVAAQLDPGFLLVPLLVPYASRLAQEAGD
jgi:ubiquinone biosynthesis protein